MIFKLSSAVEGFRGFRCDIGTKIGLKILKQKQIIKHCVL